MSRKIRFCGECKEYTMNSSCPKCSNETILAGPQRFSPEDRYGEYRRMGKRDQMKSE